MTSQPMKIHVSQLPKKVRTKGDKYGFIYGYLCFAEHSHTAYFMSDNGNIEMSRPVILAHTHLLVRYAATVYTGHEKSGAKVGQFCELTFFFV